MRKSLARLQGLGFIIWQARHYAYHILVGLVWSWFLRETWKQFNTAWVYTAIIGSVIPDIDHFIYFLTYGRHDWYTRQIRKFIRDHEWRTVTKFVASGHKYQTSLAAHNYYVMAFMGVVALVAFLYNWKSGVVFFGAMMLHYLFDVWDDVAMLGRVNPNWRRLGKPKSTRAVKAS